MLLLGLTACGGEAIDSGLNGLWVGQGSGQTLQLNLHDQTGMVTGVADLNFNWFTDERHFKVTGSCSNDMAKLQFLGSDGQEAYHLTCQRGAGWTCNLYAESGVPEPTSGTALSTARTWKFELNAVQ